MDTMTILNMRFMSSTRRARRGRTHLFCAIRMAVCFLTESPRLFGRCRRGELAPLGVHFHNDCGVGDANTLAGVLEGAIQIQGTVNGWGERCGNANLCVSVPKKKELSVERS